VNWGGEGRRADGRAPEVLGERLSRRGLLALAGGAGLAALLPGCTGDDGGEESGVAPATGTSGAGTTPSCVLTPELTEGPFYLDLDLVREDITEGKPGLPFELAVTVVDADSCRPIRDAAVDLWHCDAGGQYSGVEGDPGTFLRGIQMTGAAGAATFRTVFPGWYSGRAVHIHVKVHLGGAETFTGQLFFEPATLDTVYAREPYAARGPADVPNESDGIYGQSEVATVIDVAVSDGAASGTVTLGVRRA
jgi:protocatechuate 3,4-dioxygenase beta subunit